MAFLRKSLVRFWRRNRLPLVVCLFGMFWCGVASLMIAMYSSLVRNQDVPFNKPPPTRSPCVGHFCPFDATCLVNSTSQEPYCSCVFDCSKHVRSPVCGSNHITYHHMCQLRSVRCRHQRRIKLLHNRACDPCDGIVCKDQQVCRLNSDDKPECMCDEHCEQIVAPVCGTDGKTYSNECILRQEACRTGREISLLYSGTCNEDNPCTSLQCGPNRDCSIDRQGQATCVCPSPCEQVMRPVCGDDGLQYDNLCELRSYACRTNTDITAAHPGPCETKGPCVSFLCEYDAVCVVHGEFPFCECPVCTDEYEPVCGNDGISYENECKMRDENCREQKRTRKEHSGLCMTTDCEKNHATCRFYSVCQSDGINSRCVCPTDCQPMEAKVCGTDGVTYRHECELRVAACNQQKSIMISSFGDCEVCNGVQCRYGARCENGKCVCPLVCPDEHQPVCASNAHTYPNECEMKKEACQRHLDLDVILFQECQPDPLNTEDPNVEGSGSGMIDCDETMCQYGGVCVLDADGNQQCHCSFSCDAVRSPVCGTDGKMYGNKCELQTAACEQQTHITVQSSDNCDGIEIEEMPCDGKEPVINYSTGQPYACYQGNECPAGSYCHLQYSKCCQEELLSEIYIRDCTETPHGCCTDLHTPAPGPQQAGCPDQCQCYPPASLSLTCHPESRQCSCKPGVGGTHCDRCLPRYWGLRQIEKLDNAGCIPCNCHKLGAQREDCNQMTGRCRCHPGYEGLRCDRCKHTKDRAGSKGCPDVAKNCREKTCYHGATCQEMYPGVECICDISCDRYPSSGYVCASNNITYRNECNMRRDSCVQQKEIYITHNGRCRDTYLTQGPTEAPLTTRSRKTTRHIITPIGPPRPATKRPPVGPFGRIGDLCLEDSYCYIEHSHCHQALCKCDDGYIPTFQNTRCSEVATSPSEKTTMTDDKLTACTINPCLNRGVCIVDDSLGFRCLCALGRTGIRCKEATSFTTPSFAGASYLVLRSLGNISGDFFLEVVFQSVNRDGIVLFTSQYEDGKGQFMSVAISNRHVEFRYDLGGGHVHIRHPHPLSQDRYHQVTIKKVGQNCMLTVDNAQPATILNAGMNVNLDLSAKLYLGYLPQNMSFIMEKIGMNLGLVGCIQSVTAGQVDHKQIYDLRYPSASSPILDGIAVAPCDTNPCTSLPCMNGGTCMVLSASIFECLCLKGYTGNMCEEPVDQCTNSPCFDGATCSIADAGEIICSCPPGRKGEFCEEEVFDDILIPEFKGNGYLMLALKEQMTRHTMIEIWFLTRNKNGVLFFSSQFLEGVGDFIALNIDDLHLELRFDLGDGLVVIRSSQAISLSKWHRVSIQRTNREASMVLDGGAPDSGHSTGSLSELQSSGKIIIGGYKDKFNLPPFSNIEYNFTGIIQRLYLNGRLVENPMTEALERLNVEVYMGPPCNFNPCLNGGVCFPRLANADCRCPIQYIGERCERMADESDRSLPVKFKGDTYLQYLNEISMAQPAQRSNKFTFRLRTHETNGLLLFQNWGHSQSGDFIAVALNSGYVEFTFNLGKQTQGNTFLSTVYIADGNWHTVHVERDRRKATLQVDLEQPVKGESYSGATQLDTDGMIWIGGKMDLPPGLPSHFYSGFNGCLGYLYIKDHPLHLDDDRNTYTNIIEEFCH